MKPKTLYVRVLFNICQYFHDIDNIIKLLNFSTSKHYFKKSLINKGVIDLTFSLFTEIPLLHFNVVKIF